MPMLSVVPKHWYSWDFRIEDPVGIPWGEVALSSWRERGSVAVGADRYKVSRQGLTGPFVLEGPSGEVARAVKVSAFKREFELSMAQRDFTLKQVSWWRREYALLQGGAVAGSMAPKSWLSRRGQARLPDDMPQEVCAFVLWLILLMWKRDSDAAASS
jgi:hypothetical protein